ncbi:DnaD domain-containing protein [Paraliobacillus zengyii]|uniref:DnaD domain-containing protein n=1 Tax=Paraliobacillus zengyii TaxID=2213194 RepID=UPI0013A706DD|nr:DnaD domain protein [Paraliobacillus zengyii]
MAKFRMVHTDFWNDPKIVEEFTPEDKFFFLYLLTNSKTTQIGIYQITKKQIAFDIGHSIESVNALLDRFINHHKLVAYNPDTRELAIKNWGKYNFNRGGKPVLDCVKSELQVVKDHGLISYVGERIEKKEIRDLYDTYNDSYTIGGQEEEEEEEKEKEEEQQQQQQEESDLRNNNENVYEFYQKNMGVLSPFIAQEIGYWVQDLSEDLVVHALTIALENQKPYAYAKAIMKTWADRKIKNVDEANQLSAEFKHKQESKFSRRGTKEDIVPDWFKQQKEKRQKERSIEKTKEEDLPNVSDLLASYNKQKENRE